MAAIVGAFAVGHTSQIVRAREDAKPEQVENIYRAFRAIRRRVEELGATTLVVISSEHLMTFFLDNFPTFCIGVGESSVGWGDGGLPEYDLAVAQPLADDLVSGVVGRGFDVSFAGDMRLDHGFITPLHLIRPEADLPVVPIFQNCTTPPLPAIPRCAAFGDAIRASIEASESSDRVVVIGTGGLSHWVGVRGMGRVNERFDRELLERFRRSDEDLVLGLTTEEIDAEAGNGGQEIRNWVTAWAAAGRGPAEVLCYENVAEWVSGLGFVEFAVRQPVPA